MGCHQQDRVKLDASYMERAFFFVLLFIIVLSLQLIVLLGVECFTPGWVALSSLLSLPISVFLFRRSGLGASSRVEWGAVVVLLLAIALRSNPSSILYGGQDPGVYANTAGYFANHGTSVIRDEMIPILADRPDLREYYVQEA